MSPIGKLCWLFAYIVLTYVNLKATNCKIMEVNILNSTFIEWNCLIRGKLWLEFLTPYFKKFIYLEKNQSSSVIIERIWQSSFLPKDITYLNNYHFIKFVYFLFFVYRISNNFIFYWLFSIQKLQVKSICKRIV